MPGIGIITNPHSKQNKKDPNRPKYLSYIVGERGKLAVTNTLDELDQAALMFKEKRPDVIAINGGDGTVSRTLTALIKAYQEISLPPIALLRGGTINMLATNLDINGGSEHILHQLIETFSSGEDLKTRPISTIEVEGEYGFLYADLTCPSFLEAFYENKSNSLGSLWLVAKVLLSRFFSPKFFREIVKTAPVKVFKVDKQEYSGPSISNLAATVEKMPFGPKFFPNAKNPGKLELRSFAIDSNQAFSKVPILSLYKPEKPRKNLISVVSDQSITIEGKAPFAYTLDGELFTSKSNRLTISVGPTIEFVLF